MNSNVAYDLSRFEEKKKPTIEVVENRSKTGKNKRILGMSPAKAILSLLMVGILLSVLIYCRVLMIETNEDIRQAQKQLTILQSESTRLQMTLEGQTSLKKIEDYAINQLGMHKLDKQQVQYVSLAEDEKVVLSKDMVKPNLFQKISAWFRSAMEYLK